MKRLVRAFAISVSALAAGACDRAPLTKEEAAKVASLSIDALPPLPPDASNRYADDPRAAALGKELFFDSRLSVNGKVACATCHLPDRQFQDDKPLATAVGTGVRRTMPLAGVSWGPWYFWDGRKDSQWSQALGPLEDPVEHGGDRTSYARHITTTYATAYAAIFGPPPDLTHLIAPASPIGTQAARSTWNAMSETDRDAVNRVFANVGKAIAAFERTLRPVPTRFDRFSAALRIGGSIPDSAKLSAQELAGLRLFLGKADCTNCHNGPRLTDDHFHNTGVPAVEGLPPDGGRAKVLAAIDDDPFNCLGRYSDAKPEACGELRFMSRDAHELTRAFKPPSLREVATRPPYMHAGQFKTLEQVVAHYNSAPSAPSGHSELKPLGLSEAERAALVAFLKTLQP